MLFIKTDNKGLVLLGLLACCLFALGQASDNTPDAKNAIPLRTHSLYIPYIDQELQNRWFDFGGDAVINTNKHVRLTHDRQSQSGWLWSRLPLTATNWQVEFEFKIDGSNPVLFGDGMAVWFTKQRAQTGPVFGFMDYFEGLGIFFDTYANSRQSHSFPYVMAMKGDGKTSYDLARDGKANELAGCEADIRGRQLPTKARISYFKDNYLELKLHYKDWDQWEPCFTLSNVSLPTVYYLGFTALTGEVSDNHDVISVATNNIVAPPQRMKHPENSMYYQHSSSSWSGLLFMLKLIATVVFIGILIMVYRVYINQSNKRF
ncbi:2417_t:CDS:2 [Paraglomus occultum]|uniref:2417_t:CDS:1 n=1 Tax=Paraglomus occultum TaxID=144539 RepID=A0A9N9A1G6_9GLOM|nr:2417_t:CDS:2 [Paraglomus occultum]